jgi:hypothetical protein
VKSEDEEDEDKCEVDGGMTRDVNEAEGLKEDKVDEEESDELKNESKGTRKAKWGRK